MKPHIRKLKGTNFWICEGAGIKVWGYSICQAYRVWTAGAGIDWIKWYNGKHPGRMVIA